MTKSELIDKVSSATNNTKKNVEEIMNTIEFEITKALAKGDKVVISGFGSFEVRDRVARAGKNPRTGESIEIPAQKTPAFTAGKNLKDAVK